MILTLYDFLRIGHIKRWHNVNTIRQQTVAEHCFLVAVIALDLYQSIYWKKRREADGDPVDGLVEVAELLIGALFHDAPEAAAGDTPTPAKRLLKEITGDPELFSKLDAKLMPTLPYINEPLSLKLERVITMADAIEATHWIRENGMGTHAEMVKGFTRRKMEDLVEAYHLTEPESGWYESVNRVLMALNMPFAHRESRLSPP